MKLTKLPAKIQYQVERINRGEWLFHCQSEIPSEIDSELLNFLCDENNRKCFYSTNKINDQGIFAYEITKAGLLWMKLSTSHKIQRKVIQDQYILTLDRAAKKILEKIKTSPNDQWNKNALLYIYGFVFLPEYQTDNFIKVKRKAIEVLLFEKLLESSELTSQQMTVLRKLGHTYSEGNEEEDFGQDYEGAHDYLHRSLSSFKTSLDSKQESDYITLWHIGLVYKLIYENAIEQIQQNKPLCVQQQQYFKTVNFERSFNSQLSSPTSNGYCFGFFSWRPSLSFINSQSNHPLGSENSNFQKKTLQNFFEEQPILLFRLIQIHLIEILKSDNATGQELETLKLNVKKLLAPEIFTSMFHCSPISDRLLSERLCLLKSCLQKHTLRPLLQAELKSKTMSDFIEELFKPASAYIENPSLIPSQLEMSGPQRI